MSDENTLFVARESDLDALNSEWAKAQEGGAHVVRVAATFGGGRRALVGEFLRGIAASDDEAILWRVNCLDQENGLQWLVRMYGSLVATLTRDAMRRGKVEMVLNAQLPTQPKRVQGWYQQFVEAMRESKTDAGSGQVQLRMPKDNPLIGLVEITAAISRKIPVVLELQSPYVVNSLALALFVEALQTEAASTGGKLMVVLYDEPESDVTKAQHPMPLLDYYTRNAESIVLHEVAGWGAEEAQRYLDSKDLKADAGRLAEIVKGRPGFLAELIDILQESDRLGDLDGITLASLVPLDVDESELEVPDGEPAEGERKHASADDAGQVAFLAALLGAAFPSNLVADMGGYDRDSIGDLLDATPELFEEVQFSKELGTYIYRFKRGCWREGILEKNDSDEGHELARRVGVYMERFLVPRGYGFIVKTARVYAEHGAGARAALMRASALSNDAADIWGVAYDFSRYFDEVKWPDPLLRTIYMNLLDRLVGAGNVQAAEQVHAEVTKWSSENDDRELTAWLLYNGSKLDFRRKDLYRARDRARDALKLFEALEHKQRAAEILNHLATIELSDNNPTAALDFVGQALNTGKVEGPDGKSQIAPAIAATAEQIRGLVARRSGKVVDAVESFRRANEIAGQTGLAALALDSGFSYGEALLASNQREKARDALKRVVDIARALKSPMRERAACELLAQAEASLQNFAEALPLQQRTLELTQALKLDNVLPVDFYNLGFFHYMTKKPAEALSFFKQSAARVGSLGNHPVVKELYFFKGMAHLELGEVDQAKESLRTGLRPLQQAKDWPKMCRALDRLAAIEEGQGNNEVAKRLLTDALGFAKQGNLREERKSLKKRLDGIA